MPNTHVHEPRQTQTITATIRIAGPQTVDIDASTGRGAGTHLAITIGRVLLLCHDQRALTSYADAWIDAIFLARQLPEQVDTASEPAEPVGPSLIVRAHGSHRIKHVHDRERGGAIILVGQLAWIVADQTAWDTTTAGMRRALGIGRAIFQ